MEPQEDNKLYMNGQEVVLKNPGTKHLKDFLKLARAMSKVPKDADNSKFMEYFDDDAIDASTNLLMGSINATFKDMTPEIDDWAMKNAMLILPKVMEMCSPKKTREQSKKEELLDKIKPNNA